jgi:hypothetical protein
MKLRPKVNSSSGTCAQQADHQRRQQQRRPVADPLRDLEGKVRAQHVKTGVREIEHAHHREDERQPGCQHEQQQSIGQAVEQLDEEELEGHCHEGCWRSQ